MYAQIHVRERASKTKFMKRVNVYFFGTKHGNMWYFYQDALKQMTKLLTVSWMKHVGYYG